MARIIYAWEIGGGFGHIHAFMPLAKDLRKLGHEVIFILKDLLNAERELNAQGYRCLQAPLFLGRVVGLPDPPANFSEILLHFGFLKVDHLAGLIRAWRELFNWLKPTLIIGDYSPTALLAARSLGMPAASFGTGFCRPPQAHPLPNLRSWAPVDEKRLLASDFKLIDTVNKALRFFGSQPIDVAADVFQCAEDFLCTYAELDHYSDRHNTRYWGSVHNLEEGLACGWLGRKRYRVFAYINPSYPGLRELLGQLALLKAHEIILFCPGLASNVANRYASSKLNIVQHPVALAGIADDCNLAICHAGHGIVCAMLRAGIPLLVLPTNLEQHLTAQRVVGMGAGECVEAFEPNTDYLASLGRILKDPSYQKKAGTFQERYGCFTQTCIRAEIIGRIQELVG